VLTKLVVEQPSNKIKGHLNNIAEIARRFCAFGASSSIIVNGKKIDEIVDETDLLEAITHMLSENETLRGKLSEQSTRIAYLEELATSDELTGVLNRRGFEAELKRVLARAQRNIEHGALVYIDLDEFKPINDSFGHAAGDEVLRKVASILTDQTRDMDVVGRLGGDEFAIILVNTTRENGLERAETLNRALNEASLTWEGHTLNIQTSFGMQAYQSGDNAHELLQSADEAMYKIKQIKEAEGNRRRRSMQLKSPLHNQPSDTAAVSRMTGSAQAV